jgi:hypothetical protein
MKLVYQFLLVFILTAASTAMTFADSVSQYTADLKNIRAEVDAAIAGLVLIEQDQAAEVELARSIAAIRSAIPKPYRIADHGAEVEIDFQWLTSALDGIPEAENLFAKMLILNRIRDRLASIQSRVDELTSAEAAGKSSQENKEKLDEILGRTEFQKPKEPEESLFAKWWRELREWLERQVLEADRPRRDGVGMQNFATVFQILLFIGIAALIAFLIYRFYPLIAERLGLLREDKREKRVILGEQIGADVSASDLLSEAEQLARDGELRLAVRKGYIALLCDLSDRRIISLARHKTNRDYLKDVRKKPGLHSAVSGATSNFERTWYGLADAEASDWNAFREAYSQALAEAGRS